MGVPAGRWGPGPASCRGIDDGALLDRCARDIRRLLVPDDLSEAEDFDDGADVVGLWDGGDRVVVG